MALKTRLKRTATLHRNLTPTGLSATRSLHRFGARGTVLGNTETIRSQPPTSRPSHYPHVDHPAKFKSSAFVSRADMSRPLSFPVVLMPDTEMLTMESIAEIAHALQDRIRDLWKKVWFGLYQAHDADGPTHATQLRSLYMGAGMAELMHPRGSDRSHLLDHSYRTAGLVSLADALHEDRTAGEPAIARLTLYHGLASHFHSVITLLREYEGQIEPLSQLYQFLRHRQVGAQWPTTEDQRIIFEQYPKLADPIAKTLINLDAQMKVLLMDMEHEAREVHGALRESKGVLVADHILRKG
jgi:hypothetical protein